MTKTFRIWAFGIRYCLVFSVSNLGFDPCLPAALQHHIILRSELLLSSSGFMEKFLTPGPLILYFKRRCI